MCVSVSGVIATACLCRLGEECVWVRVRVCE